MNAKRILVPVTLSAGSRAAVAVAAKLAQELGATMVLLHVVPGAPASPASVESGPRSSNNSFWPAEKKMREFAWNARISGAVEFVVGAGTAAEIILEQARNQAADAIVMCTHGYRGWLRWMHRCTAQRVIRQAACPVWLVSPGKGTTVELRVAGRKVAGQNHSGIPHPAYASSFSSPMRNSSSPFG